MCKLPVKLGNLHIARAFAGQCTHCPVFRAMCKTSPLPPTCQSIVRGIFIHLGGVSGKSIVEKGIEAVFSSFYIETNTIQNRHRIIAIYIYRTI
jgi:hypothetical protein